MCEFFVKADPILYESRTRTMRIHGVLTRMYQGRMRHLPVVDESGRPVGN